MSDPTITTPTSGVVVSSGETLDVLAGGEIISGVVNSGGLAVILSGGLDTSTDIDFGGAEYVSGGQTNNTVVNGTQSVFSGGIASGSILTGSGEQIVSSGGVADGTQVGSDSQIAVSSGGIASNAVISGGGSYGFVYEGGSIVSSTVGPGGDLEVSSGGAATGSIVSNASMAVSEGGTASGTTVLSGGELNVVSGTVSGSIIQAGGYEYLQDSQATNESVAAGGSLFIEPDSVVSGLRLESGGGMTNSGTVVLDDGDYINAAGIENVGSIEVNGGAVIDGTIENTGMISLLSGATGSGLVLSGGGTLEVSSGAVYGSAISDNGTIILDAGVTWTGVEYSGKAVTYVGPGAADISGTFHDNDEHISGSGAYGANETFFAGELFVSAGGVASGAELRDGAYMGVGSGGTAIGTIVGAEGSEQFVSGGIASGTVVDSGGYSYAYDGGTQSDSVVNGGGHQEIESGGIAFATTVNSGGDEFLSGGATTGTTVFAGGNQEVVAGGIASDTVLSGGTATVGSGGLLDVSASLANPDSGLLVFSGGGVIEIDGTMAPEASIFNFDGGGETIDLTGIGGVITNSSYSIDGDAVTFSGTSGSMTLFIVGAEGGAAYTMTSDGNGGIDITPSAPEPTIGLLPASDSGVLGDDITNNTAPTLTGTGVVGDTIVLLDGTTEIGSGTVGIGGTWSIVPGTALNAGTHDLSAIQHTPGGVVSSPSPFTLVIDTDLPELPGSLTLAPVSDSGVSGDDLTNVALPTITGTATAGDTVTLYDGVTLIGTGTANGSGAWSITATTALDQGLNVLFATDTDIAGNVSIPSAPLLVTLDTLAPTAPDELVLAPLSDSGVTGDDLTNVALPTITGNADPGDTVTLYDGVTLIGTGTADGSGAWSIIATTALDEGANSLTATATDAAGNISDVSAALVVTLDTNTPVPPGSPTLASVSDSGVSGDDLTNVVLPTITGIADPGATVTLYDNEILVGTGTADGSGAWSITATSLIEGTNSLTATATDMAGNVSDVSTALVVTLDTLPPPPPIGLVLAPVSDSGVSGDDLTNVALPTITGTATAGDTVTLYDGVTLIGTGTANGSGAWSITATTALDQGLNVLFATDTDIAGNVSIPSAPLLVTLDTLAPTAPDELVLAPLSDSGVTGDDLTNVALPTITGNADPGDTVTLYDGVTLIGTGTADGSGAWSIIATTALDEGANSLTATATDAAGNISDVSAALVVTLDTNTPVPPGSPTLASVSDSGVSGDDLTNVVLPTITGIADPGATVTLYDNEILVGTGTADGSGAWSITATSLIEGTNSLTATATDMAGNVSDVSTALVVTLDTLPPPPPIGLVLAPVSDSGVSGDDLTNVALPTITGTATAGDTVTLYDGVTLIGTGTANGSGAWSITATTALDQGLNVLFATDTDIAGNVSIPSAPLLVTLDTLAPTAPDELVLAPLSDSGVTGDDLTNVALPTITGNADPGDTVTLYDGVTLIGTGTADGSGAWSIIATTALDEGANSLTATATDAAGNISDVSAALVVTLDTNTPVPPGSPTLASVSDSGVSGDDLTNVVLPTITGIADPGATVTLYDNEILVGTGTADGSGAWSITATSLIEGTNSLTATATDMAGNVSDVSTALVVTLDTLPPPPPIGLVLAPVSDSGVSGDDLTNVALPTITGTATAGDTVTLYDGVTLIGTGTADGSGAWSITATTALDQGLNVLFATDTDIAGNVSIPSAPLLVTLDTLAPTAPDELVLAPLSDSGASGDDLTNVALPTITGNADPGDTVTLYDGVTLIGTGTADGSGAWSIIATTALDEGANSLTATATDAAGNISDVSAALVVTLDTVAPAVPTLGETVDATNPAEPIIAGTAEVGSLVRLYQDDALVGTATAAEDGTWGFTFSTGLVAGSYTLTATATDNAGNVSAISTGLPLQVNADNSYVVTAPISGTTNTQSFVYDTTGVLSTVETKSSSGLLLVSVSNTAALINIYDSSGTLIGTITQPSTSVFGQPVFDTTPLDSAASTGSGPTGSVVNLLSENNVFVSQGNDSITVHDGTATITATGPTVVVQNMAASVTFYGGSGSASVYGGSGTVVAFGGAGGGMLVGGTAGGNTLVGGGGTTTIVGGGDGDTLFGSTNGTDTIYAGSGTEILVGGGGNSILVAGDGDSAFGGSGQSTLFASATGNSVLAGGSGQSTLWGGAGSDVFFGNADINSDTVMIGGSGESIFLGLGGTSTAYGGGGNDQFWVGSGAMTIVEGGGTDIVGLGAGAAMITGGSGIDLYALVNGKAGGADTISNFKVGVDHIAALGYGADPFQEEVTGGSTVLTFTDHTTITLVGVSQLGTGSILS